jgi:UDP-N-acetylglucosamine:LPS N-acetylglucosamine transferase
MVALPRIVVISASFGAGHDGAADELSRRLKDLGFRVDRHDFLDFLPLRLGTHLRRAYRKQLAIAPKSWKWLLDLGRSGWLSDRTGDLLRIADRAMLRAIGPDAAVVVSTYPLASQMLGRMRRTARLTAPVVTYLTDMSVHPLWIADGVDTHLAIHSVAAADAKAHGGADVRVIDPAVRPAFTRPRTPAQQRFGLPAGKPLALIVAGSWGVGAVERTSYDIAATGLAVPVVACGTNQALQDRLDRADHAIALGWVDDMASLMRACHVVVQNAGGLSSLEALACGVPVVSYRCIPGHGQTNAERLEQAGWVPWIRGFAELPSALEKVFREPPPRIDVAAEEPEDVIAMIASLQYHSRQEALVR